MSNIDRLTLADTDLTQLEAADIPDGQSRRFTHKGCSDSRNGAAYRSGAGVTLRCFKCGGKGFAFLGVPSLYASAGAVPATSSSVPVNFKPEHLHPTNPIHARARVYLGKYGVDHSYPNVFVNATNGNLALGSSDFDGVHNGWCIRNLDPMFDSKWMNFYQSKLRVFVVEDIDARSDCVVLVEDPISAMRVHAASGFSSVALLGLNLDSDALGEIASRFKSAIVWTDADWSGLTRGALIRDGLQACMPTVMVRGVPGCKDPKDHTAIDIQHIVGTAYLIIKEEANEWE